MGRQGHNFPLHVHFHAIPVKKLNKWNIKKRIHKFEFFIKHKRADQFFEIPRWIIQFKFWPFRFLVRFFFKCNFVVVSFTIFILHQKIGKKENPKNQSNNKIHIHKGNINIFYCKLFNWILCNTMFYVVLLYVSCRIFFNSHFDVFISCLSFSILQK